MLPLQVIQILQAVQKAKQRIPKELRGITFFSFNDRWLYQESEHDNMCDECHSMHLEVYGGDQLRGTFPWLEVVNEDFIYPHVHPNCHCALVRVYPVEIIEDD